MSNLSKPEFVALDISRKNYLSWVLDAEICLAAKSLDGIITQGNESSSQDKPKAMIFLRHHLDEGLKIEYLMVKDALELWTDLKGRYDHLKATMLPRARYEWMHLRFQDFKTKYSELISCLLVAEQHNALLMKNHEARSTGAAPLSEAYVVEARDQSEVKREDHRGYNNARGRDKDKRQYTNRRDGGHNKRENNMSSQNNPSKSNCLRRGMKHHWKNECRTHEHFVKLYKNSFKRKGNKSGASSSNARAE
ncbi:uncharacterized protein LOC107004007 [Solanum pennellii]|uniref:Uncharacterized protein LOC107004007 n=1 Tax=Solanum pennellii TaxID=28526 RepID=A0ABM1FJ95_SOLPN|nr:uncharacterized protein LOC107004007 [Solanum pennellii]